MGKQTALTASERSEVDEVDVSHKGNNTIESQHGLRLTRGEIVGNRFQSGTSN